MSKNNVIEIYTNLKIDIAELEAQYKTLIDISNHPALTTEEKRNIEGLINFLEAYRDEIKYNQ